MAKQVLKKIRFLLVGFNVCGSQVSTLWEKTSGVSKEVTALNVNANAKNSKAVRYDATTVDTPQ